MLYFKNEIDLIQYNPETKIYRIRNTLLKNAIITKTQFELLNCVQIKKHIFYEFLNVYFKNVDDCWKYQGHKFKKLKNFENNKDGINFICEKLPNYIVNDYIDFCHANLKIVYHWGKIYYFECDGNYLPRGKLYNIEPIIGEPVRWVHIKNIAPVYNKTLKQII